eukprot:SAG31_NODE_639_length_13309_cov_4.008468_7_plen_267_part_00
MQRRRDSPSRTGRHGADRAPSRTIQNRGTDSPTVSNSSGGPALSSGQRSDSASDRPRPASPARSPAGLYGSVSRATDPVPGLPGAARSPAGLYGSVSRSFAGATERQHLPVTRAASSRIGSALTDGMSQLLSEAVEGPLQRVFATIDERFEDMSARINELERQNEGERGKARSLQRERDELLQRIEPLATEVRQTAEENKRLRKLLEQEAAHRHDELEEVNGVLKQMALAIDRIGDETTDTRDSMQTVLEDLRAHAGTSQQQSGAL